MSCWKLVIDDWTVPRTVICGIIFMYSYLEIVTQQEPPTSCTLDALRRMSNAYFERSPGNAGRARDG